MLSFARFRRSCLVAIIAALSGCATVDFDYPKEETTVLTDTADTYLGKELAGLADQHPGESGFFPIGDGIEALAALL